MLYLTSQVPRLIWIGIWFLALNVSAYPLLAQPTSTKTKPGTADFQQGLVALAAQGHTAIIAEGTPLFPQLSPEKTPDLSKAKSFSEAVAQFALAYDYDVSAKGGVVLLKKRYTNPNDLPDVTLDECRKAMENVVKVMDAFSPHLQMDIHRDVVKETYVDGFLKMLSPEQMALLEADKPENALRVAALNPEQRALINQMALYFYVQNPESDAQGILNGLREAPTRIMRNHDDNGKPDFGYEYENPNPKKTLFMSLIDTGLLTPSQEPKPDLDQLDKAMPDTLATVVATLKVSDAQARFAVDPALAPKTVSVAGRAYAAPDALMQGLATVYGLRVKREDNNPLLLTMPVPVFAADVQGIPGAIRRNLPEPLLRCLHDASVFRSAPENDKPSRHFAFSNPLRLGQMEAESHRRLQALCAPLIEKTPGGRLPFSAFSPTANMRMADAIVVRSLRTVLVTATPANFVDFDNVIVTGHWYPDPDHPGKQVHSLFLRSFSPDFRSHTGIGIGYGP